MPYHGPSDEAISGDDSDVAAMLRRVAHISAVAMGGVEATLPVQGSEASAVGSGGVLPALGEVVDARYRIESVLGEGGMGVVFSAHNLRTGREVALKYTIPRERHRQDSEQERRARLERFVREAHAGGRVRHENVVDIYDAGGDPTAPYLVMERLHGESLAARMRRGPLSIDEAVELVRQAARGVASAHRRGVVHRDLKPENLFLCTTAGSSSPTVKVLDFGVSRIVDPALDLSPITRSGTIIGTPAYMPLEQLRAEREVDTRADVYALGAILYEAVSGARPYQANTVHDLLLRMATGQHTPLREHVGVVPVWLDACIFRCLSRDPSERYADAQELLDALEAQNERAPTEAVVEEPRRSSSKRIVIAALLAVGGGALLVSRMYATEPKSLVATERLVSTTDKPSTTFAAEPIRQALEQAPSEPAPLVPESPSPKREALEEMKPEPRTRGTARPNPRPALPDDPGLRARDIRPEDF